MKSSILLIVVIIFLRADHILCCALSGDVSDKYYELDIIHYNDFHARFEETSEQSSVCRFDNASCVGGFARMYHAITSLMEEKPNALLLNAGDSFQGTYWYTLFKGEVIQHFLNLLPNDAHAIGNHDFDDGPEALAAYLASLKAPSLAANMNADEETILQGLYKSHEVFQRNGKLIGVIGLSAPETGVLSVVGRVKFTDIKEAMRKEIDILDKKGVDIIIVLSHCGRPLDIEIAQEFGEHVDVIVGGHTHREENAEPNLGPYPVIEHTTDDDSKVLIIQASAFSKHVGNISIFFDSCGDYVKWEGNVVYLNRSIPEDQEIKKELEPYAKLVHEAEKLEIGETEVAMDFEECAGAECLLGNLVTDALNDHARLLVATSYDYVAFAQRSYLKTSFPKGKIRMGTLVQMTSYYDQVETFELQGKYLHQALETGVSDAWEYDPFSAPWMLQVAGLRVKYNVSMPEGHRVISVRVGESLKPLCKNKYYQVTCPGYLAEGGERFEMFPQHRRNMKIIGRDQKVMETYIRRYTPLKMVIDGRIKILD